MSKKAKFVWDNLLPKDQQALFEDAFAGLMHCHDEQIWGDFEDGAEEKSLQELQEWARNYATEHGLKLTRGMKSTVSEGGFEEILKEHQ